MKVHKSRKFNTAAIILSGCGHHDGSEITETIAIIVALRYFTYYKKCFHIKYIISKIKVNMNFYAPDLN